MALSGDAIKNWRQGRPELEKSSAQGTLSYKAINSFIDERETERKQEEGKERLKNATPTLKMVQGATLLQVAKEAQLNQQNDIERLKSIDQEAGLDISYQPGGEISSGEKSTFAKVRDALPKPVQDYVLDPIKEGLFGRTGEEGDRGVINFLTGLKSEEQRILDRFDALREAGIEEQRAIDLAVRDVRNKGPVQKLSIAGGVSVDDASEAEQKALASVGRWESVDNLMFALDLGTLGGSKVVRTAVREGVKPLKNLARGSDEAAHTIMRAVDDTTVPTEVRARWFDAFKKKTNEAWITLRETVEDEWVRVKKLQQQEGAVVGEGADPYTAEILSSGRTGVRLAQSKEVAQQINSDIVEVARRAGDTPEGLTSKINDYLVALHAGERIREVGEQALNITAKQADDILAGLKADAQFAEIKRIADNIKKFHDETLDILLNGGLIKKSLYDTLRTKYKNHVPLQRILDTDDDVGSVLVRRGTDVTSTGIKRAKGSQREIADILENIVYNREQAIIRAEKNRVALNIARFAENNKLLGIFKKVKPAILGKGKDGQPIMQMVTDPQVLQYYENGVKKLLKIEDAKLAAALRGINRWKLDPFMRSVATFTRFYSGLATRFNPEFALSNKIRDIQEAVIYAAASGQGGRAVRVAGRDPASMKTVTDFIRGVDNNDTKLFRQMMEDGGTTGGYALSTRKAVELDIGKIRKLSRSAPRRAALRVIESIDNFNQIFEDSTRFSVYKEALAQGMSRTQAARMAKESTINFNKMGTGGPVINGLYMFANASIQGSAKMLRALRNPKVAASVVTSVGAAVYSTNEHNENIDPEWRDKVTEWDRMNSLIVVLPPGEDGEFNYAALPVSWGIKPIKVAMDAMYDVTTGYDVEVGDAALKIFSSLWEGYNPIGGTDAGQILTPTILDTPIDIYRNNAWYGGKIAPDSDKKVPDQIRYWPDLRDSASGQNAIRIAQGLSHVGIEVSPENILYAFEQYIGGAGRSVNKVVDTVTAIAGDEEVQVKNVPFLSRFYRQRQPEEIGAGTEKLDTIREYQREQSLERHHLNEQAEDAYFTMKNSDNPEELWSQLNKKDPELARRVAQIKRNDDLGLNYSERQIMTLGVKNGERARYLYEVEFSKAETKEEKAQLWEYFVQKKLITEEVGNQIKYLIKNE